MLGIFTVATFISYGLQCYVPVEIIWGNYLSKRFNGKLVWEFAVRVTIVLITCKLNRRHSIKCHFEYNFSSSFFFSVLLAISVPQLALFISLFGALCLSVLGIAFPAVMEICVLYPDRLGRCYIVIIRNIILIIIGMFALITGTNKSLSDIITTFQTPQNATVLNNTISILTTSTEPNSV